MAVATRVIRWSEIAAQCGNYKAGFVAVFREHEGKETDERDPRGVTIKVTRNSFAEHMGIPRETFHRWVRMADDPNLGLAEARQERTAASHANVVKNMAKRDPVALVNAIEEAGPYARDFVQDELKLRQAGIPPSTRANRKAAEAQASQVADPWKQAMMRDSCETMPAVIDELTEDLEKQVAAGNVAKQTLGEIIVAVKRLLTTAEAARPFGQ